MKLLGPDWQDRDTIGLMKASEEQAARELLRSLGGVSLVLSCRLSILAERRRLLWQSSRPRNWSRIPRSEELRLRLRMPHSWPTKRYFQIATWETARSYLSLWILCGVWPSTTWPGMHATYWVFCLYSHQVHLRIARDHLFRAEYSVDGILIDLFLPTNQKVLDGKLAFCKQHPSHVDAASQATLSNVIRPPHQLQAAIDELLNFTLIKRKGRNIWAHRVVQEAMNYHSFGELQEYFNSASELVYEAFPKQTNGDYLTRDQRGACLSYIPHAAHLSVQFSIYHRTEAAPTLKGYERLPFYLT